MDYCIIMTLLGGAVFLVSMEIQKEAIPKRKRGRRGRRRMLLKQRDTEMPVELNAFLSSGPSVYTSINMSETVPNISGMPEQSQNNEPVITDPEILEYVSDTFSRSLNMSTGVAEWIVLNFTKDGINEIVNEPSINIINFGTYEWKDRYIDNALQYMTGAYWIGTDKTLVNCGTRNAYALSFELAEDDTAVISFNFHGSGRVIIILEDANGGRTVLYSRDEQDHSDVSREQQRGDMTTSLSRVGTANMVPEACTASLPLSKGMHSLNVHVANDYGLPGVFWANGSIGGTIRNNIRFR